MNQYDLNSNGVVLRVEDAVATTQVFTEFAPFHKGKAIGMTMRDVTEAVDYVAGGIRAGNEASDYEVRSRVVSRTEVWTGWEVVR